MWHSDSPKDDLHGGHSEYYDGVQRLHTHVAVPTRKDVRINGRIRRAEAHCVRYPGRVYNDILPAVRINLGIIHAAQRLRTEAVAYDQRIWRSRWFPVHPDTDTSLDDLTDVLHRAADDVSPAGNEAG